MMKIFAKDASDKKYEKDIHEVYREVIIAHANAREAQGLYATPAGYLLRLLDSIADDEDRLTAEDKAFINKANEAKKIDAALSKFLVKELKFTKFESKLEWKITSIE